MHIFASFRRYYAQQKKFESHLERTILNENRIQARSAGRMPEIYAVGHARHGAGTAAHRRRIRRARLRPGRRTHGRQRKFTRLL